MIGTRLSHYLILERLGGGGQGVVYRARDERLHRDVAIKVLPAGALANEGDRKQFRREALNLSRLNHPNVQTIHDFNSQDGVDYLVLELVGGPTLTERIAAEPMAEEEIARLGRELAEGLEAAHMEGIFHRDIKPANLKITASGRLKILDFGLAKAMKPLPDISSTETLSGSGVAGTLPYMAPEQIRGLPPDARSDIHAVGAVLYEMACRRRAFPQESAPALIGAILEQAPSTPSEIRPGMSRDLERIIMRCLEKEPRQRYPVAREVAEELKELATPADRWKGILRGLRLHRRALALWAGVITLGVLFALDAGGYRTLATKGCAASAERSLAVLPMANLSGDPGQEYFADGMTDELITRLSQVGALRVISRSSIMQYKGTKKPIRQIARELNVNLIVEASTIRSGDQVRVSATLVDPSTDRHLWAESYQRKIADVLMLQGDLARAIVDKIRVELRPREKTKLATAGAVNPEAYRLYLIGRFHVAEYTGESLSKAREEFQRAIEIDPLFAPAHASLGEVYFGLSSNYLPSVEAMPRARAEALRAIEIDPELASAHAILGSVQLSFDWDWAGAERSCMRAIELSPNDAMAHQVYGGLLTYVGRFKEAEAELRRARQIDPLSGFLGLMSIWPLFEGRQFDRAETAAERIVQADPNSALPRLVLGQALLFGGKRERAISELRRSAALDTTLSYTLGWLSYAYGMTGDRKRALETLQELEAWGRRSYVQPYIFLLAHLGLQDKEKALYQLEKAFELRSDEMVFLKVDPVLDPLRSEPRFQAILRQMKFPA